MATTTTTTTASIAGPSSNTATTPTATTTLPPQQPEILIRTKDPRAPGLIAAGYRLVFQSPLYEPLTPSSASKENILAAANVIVAMFKRPRSLEPSEQLEKDKKRKTEASAKEEERPEIAATKKHKTASSSPATLFVRSVSKFSVFMAVNHHKDLQPIVITEEEAAKKSGEEKEEESDRPETIATPADALPQEAAFPENTLISIEVRSAFETIEEHGGTFIVKSMGIARFFVRMVDNIMASFQQEKCQKQLAVNKELYKLQTTHPFDFKTGEEPALTFERFVWSIVYSIYRFRPFFDTVEQFNCVATYLSYLIRKVVAMSGNAVTLTNTTRYRIFAIAFMILDKVMSDKCYKPEFYREIFGLGESDQMHSLCTYFFVIIGFYIPSQMEEQWTSAAQSFFPKICSNPTTWKELF